MYPEAKWTQIVSFRMICHSYKVINMMILIYIFTGNVNLPNKKVNFFADWHFPVKMDILKTLIGSSHRRKQNRTHEESLSFFSILYNKRGNYAKFQSCVDTTEKLISRANPRVNSWRGWAPPLLSDMNGFMGMVVGRSVPSFAQPLKKTLLLHPQVWDRKKKYSSSD